MIGNLTQGVRATLLLALAFSLSVTRLAGQSVPAPSTTALAFTHVNVVDVEYGRVLSDQTVLIRGQWIEAIGPGGSVLVPADAQVVHAEGGYLIPGLWDTHTHSGGDELARTIDLPLYVAHGVTGVRELRGSRVATRGTTAAAGPLQPGGRRDGPRRLRDDTHPDRPLSTWTSHIRTAARVRASTSLDYRLVLCDR